MQVEINRKKLLEHLLTAYELGSYATKKVNFGKKGFTKADEAKERAALNRILQSFGMERVSESEYRPFTR